MRFILSFLAILMFIDCFSAVAQDQNPVSTDGSSMDSLLTRKKNFPCREYSDNAREILPSLLNAKEYDSAKIILSYISNKCPGISFRKVELLMQLAKGQITNSWCDTSYFEDLFRFYGNWMEGLLTIYADFPYDPGYIECFYDRGFFDVAQTLLTTQDTTSIAHALLLYLGGREREMRSNLSRGQYTGTCIQHHYDHMIDSLVRHRDQTRIHLAFLSGTWIPMDKAQLFGNKFEFGVQFGARFGKVGGDVSFLVRGFGSKNSYSFRYANSIRESRHFVGAYFGFDPTYEVFWSRSIIIEIFGGIGHDWIEVLGDSKKKEYENLQSLNLNTGFTLYFFYNKYKTKYFGIQPRFNRVHYYTHGGSNLEGNSVSLNVVWGYLADPSATARHRYLNGDKEWYDKVAWRRW